MAGATSDASSHRPWNFLEVIVVVTAAPPSAPRPRAAAAGVQVLRPPPSAPRPRAAAAGVQGLRPPPRPHGHGRRRPGFKYCGPLLGPTATGARRPRVQVLRASPSALRAYVRE